LYPDTWAGRIEISGWIIFMDDFYTFVASLSSSIRGYFMEGLSLFGFLDFWNWIRLHDCNIDIIIFSMNCVRSLTICNVKKTIKYQN
jgi:hypothetical protein